VTQVVKALLSLRRRRGQPNMHTHVCTHVHTHIHTYTRAHAYTHMHTCIYTNMHIHTHVHTHIHTHIYTHTHTHTHRRPHKNNNSLFKKLSKFPLHSSPHLLILPQVNDSVLPAFLFQLPLLTFRHTPIFTPVRVRSRFSTACFCFAPSQPSPGASTASNVCVAQAEYP
jgi:hypothetical protein